MADRAHQVGEGVGTSTEAGEKAARRAGLALAGVWACGKSYGAAETLDLGRVANENPPKLHIVDGKGNRIDFVEFHPAYHALMERSIGHGIHASAHDGSDPA